MFLTPSTTINEYFWGAIRLAYSEDSNCGAYYWFVDNSEHCANFTQMYLMGCEL